MENLPGGVANPAGGGSGASHGLSGAEAAQARNPESFSPPDLGLGVLLGETVVLRARATDRVGDKLVDLALAADASLGSAAYAAAVAAAAAAVSAAAVVAAAVVAAGGGCDDGDGGEGGEGGG